MFSKDPVYRQMMWKDFGEAVINFFIALAAVGIFFILYSFWG